MLADGLSTVMMGADSHGVDHVGVVSSWVIVGMLFDTTTAPWLRDNQPVGVIATLGAPTVSCTLGDPAISATLGGVAISSTLVDDVYLFIGENIVCFGFRGDVIVSIACDIRFLI